MLVIRATQPVLQQNLARTYRTIGAATFSHPSSAPINANPSNFTSGMKCAATIISQKKMRADQNEQYAQGTDTLSKTIMYMQGFFVKATPIVGKQICVWVI